MGGVESTIPANETLDNWEEQTNINSFYRLIELAEPQIVNMLNDYKYKLEYDLLHENNGDSIFLDMLFTYTHAGKTITYNGNDIYKTEHPDIIDKFSESSTINKNSHIYDTYDNWKQFRSTALLSNGYADIPNDLYWKITDINPTKTYTWFDLFTSKYEKDRKNMRSSYMSNTQLKTYNDLIIGMQDNKTASSFIDALNGELTNASNNLEQRQTTYNNIYSNLIFHSYSELITAAQSYYRDTKYIYDLYNKGLLGLLDYYIDLCKGKHIVYTTIPDDATYTFDRVLYDTKTERSLGNIPEDFVASENNQVKRVLSKRFNNNEKKQLRDVFRTAWRNNYIRLLNTYLQICALIMDSKTYNQYFNTTNGYIKTLSDKDISNKYPSLVSSEYLIDEETSIDNKYVYGILSRRVILPVSSLKIVKNNKTITFNANRRDLQLTEYYIIQLLRWLLNDDTDTIQLTDGWSVSLADELGTDRKSIIKELYLNKHSAAIASIKDLGQPFAEQSFDQDYIDSQQSFINDYNAFISAYTFCNRNDVIAEFKTYPNRTTEPNTDKIIKLKSLLQEQTDETNIKSGLFGIDYYAYRINMLINGCKGWSCFKDVLHKETYLISYVLYYYSKKYEKWISKYLKHKGFISYFDKYLGMFHNDSTTQYGGDALAIFENEPDDTAYTSYTMRVGKMYHFLLSQEQRAKINPDYKGTIGNIYNKWSLLSCCLECYDGIYKPFYDCVSYIVRYYGKWMNLLFTDYIPSQTDDKQNVKRLPLLQETNAALKTLPNQLCSYLFDVGIDVSNKKKILRLVNNYDAEPYIASIISFITQTMEQVNIAFSLDENYDMSEIKIKLSDDTKVVGFDKKTIKCANNSITGNKAMSNVLQRCWVIDPEAVSMPSVPDDYINKTNELIDIKNKYTACSSDCDELIKQYTTISKKYEKFIKSFYMYVCPIDNLRGIYKTCANLIPNIKILMTITYFILYRFSSSVYNKSNIASQQLPTNMCYNDVGKLIDDALNKNIDGGWQTIENDYNEILSNNIAYCNIDGEDMTLGGLMAVFMVVINCKISQLYNNAVRTYYEKHMAINYDEDTDNKLNTSELSTINNNLSIIQRGIVENDKVGTRN